MFNSLFLLVRYALRFGLHGLVGEIHFNLVVLVAILVHSKSKANTWISAVGHVVRVPHVFHQLLLGFELQISKVDKHFKRVVVSKYSVSKLCVS